jgi:N-acetylmuramoyl-L-alanine amidase
LHYGDTNTNVKRLQARLISLGYLSGTADGVFGSRTTLAVKRFQARVSLTADGVVGYKTVARLFVSTAPRP